MPTLNWIGKDKVVNYHNQVPFRVLDHKYGYDGNAPESRAFTGSGNKIIHGDNLEALKALLPEYEGKIDCVYIDPPYNTGNEGWIYNDNVNDPHIRKWLGEVVGAEGEDLSRHDKWLCMMYPRLMLLYKLLKRGGLIFISINDFELNRLYLICDEIFSIKNNVATFVWKSRAKPANTGSAKYKPQKDAEYILCYKKIDDREYNNISTGNERSYPHSDEEGEYRIQTILKSNRGESHRETMNFEVNGYKPPIEQRWQAGYDTIKDLFDRNRITFETGNPMRKIYRFEEDEEVSPFYCFIEKQVSGSAETGKDTLNKIVGNQHGFDTVKPVQLINYLLQHSMPKDAIILDCFGGSGTTAQSVLELNHKDGGNRKFIIVEIMDYAERIIAERTRRVISGYTFTGKVEEEVFVKKLTASNLSSGKELMEQAIAEAEKNKDKYDKISKPKVADNCLKVIGTKEYKGNMDGIGGAFDYYELGNPLFLEDDTLNAKVGINDIRSYIYFSETHQRLTKQIDPEFPYLLDYLDGIGYFFYYKPGERTVLTHESLTMVPHEAEHYVIYANACSISREKLASMNITFKKITGDINRF